MNKIKKNQSNERKLSFLYLLSRFTPLIFGFFGAFLCTLYLNPTDQGIFFLLLSFVSAQVLFEGGMYFQMQQKLAALVKNNGNLIKETDNEIVSALWLKSFYFLFIVSVMYFVIIYAVASFILHDISSNAKLYLELFFLLISLRFIISGIEAMLEGAGYREYIARIRIYYSLINGFLLCFFLASDYGLSSLVLSYSISVFLLLIFHLIKKGKIFFLLISNGLRKKNKFSWRKEMLPVQMKLSVSWVFGFFSQQSLVPIIFYLSGPVIAGQFGFLMSIVNAIKSLSSSFIAKESPLFGVYISSKNYYELKYLLKKLVYKTIILLTILVICSFVGIYLLSIFNPDILNRITSLPAMAIILLSIYVIQMNLILANYVRAHNEEPFMAIVILGGILLPLSIALSSYYSNNDVVIASSILIMWILMGIYAPYRVAKPYLDLLKLKENN